MTSEADYDQIRMERVDTVTVIVLSRPKAKNAMTDIMGFEIQRMVKEINADDSTRVVLIRGDGDVFCAGADFSLLSQRATQSEEQNRKAMREFYGLFLSILDVRVPTIAVIHGAAIGAGLCFALACDLRICSRQARLAFNFVRIGLHPGMGATYFLPRVVGPAKANELLMTGKMFDGEAAYEMGLVNAVHEEAVVYQEGVVMANEIARAAPVAVEQTKASMRRSLGGSLNEALEAEAWAQAIDFGTGDLAEGVQALREKRAARFRGQ